MNEYDFDLEFPDGSLAQYRTCAVNKLMAYEMLIEYLRDYGVQPDAVKVLNVYIEVLEEDDE